jgi:hypothetical protein
MKPRKKQPNNKRALKNLPRKRKRASSILNVRISKKKETRLNHQFF